MHGNPVANFSVTRPSPGTGWINDTNAPTKKPRERVHMAVPMFVHGGDSAVGEEEKKKKEEEWKRRDRRKRSTPASVPLIISSGTAQWPPCGRLFRGRLNEAD